MGSASSKQRLGDRVLAARKKLLADTAMQKARYEQLLAASPETLDVLVRSIGAAFSTHSAFPEAALLVAFAANPEEVQRIISKCCKKLLSAPIAPAEYEWFMRYVFPSSVWLQRGKDGQFMFERMLQITQSMAEKIRQSMDDIHVHLAASPAMSSGMDATMVCSQNAKIKVPICYGRSQDEVDHVWASHSRSAKICWTAVQHKCWR